ncbi:sulfite exporter TauE/SafE family protein [Oceanispirochaeta crateris]|uniref:Probable membrane transporter protein n=1 Tax=Oceanispirochaeta crateris TaxID=2518645 RepID=A0A5C1QKV3_9SPIO|nr:sulfite exporter TauE/SafE family protein [Oceanispirochaeta crateris]QEN07234.1 sulfite exporter TauE/SafE family protein [Oceanispirochaeta crateris]
MIKIIMISISVFAIGLIMTMSGRGGGNFYVPLLVIAGLGMHQAATMGQFILMIAAITGMFVFNKKKMVDWKLALVIDPPTDIMAFVGGYFSNYISGATLKIVLSGFLVLAGIFMLIKVKERPIHTEKQFGYWHRKFGEEEYVVNLWYTIPITALAGLVAGSVGISGGSFKIPLMVLLCGVPMHIAVGTSTAMVAATAIMGFLGHTMRGHFEPQFAIPLAIAAILAGIFGGKLAIKTNPKYLKRIFAITTFLAAIVMIINVLSM